MHRYFLNREPKLIENVKLLVDGSHWTSKKQFKKGVTGSNGHLGCSESYNIYKQHVKSDVNDAKDSQGREQLHSTLIKLSKSLRQKNYINFMRYVKVFFAVNNLIKMHKI